MNGVRIGEGSIVGAGSFGLLHLLAPNVFVQLLNAPSNTTMLGDMFVASVFLAFSVLAITNLKKPDSYAPIAGFQGISKKGDITTIGRGGSDATAVAVAKKPPNINKVFKNVQKMIFI